MDRDFVRLEDGSILYAELYSSHGLESMNILSGSIGEDGIVWDCLHTWDIMLDAEPVQVAPNALVEIYVYDGTAWFTFREDFFTYEGMVCIYLSLDLSTGEFTEDCVDQPAGPAVSAARPARAPAGSRAAPPTGCR